MTPAYASTPCVALGRLTGPLGGALESGESDPAAPFRCTGLWTGLGDGSALGIRLRYVEEPVHVLYTDYSRSKGQSLWNSVNILSELIFK